MLNRRKLTLVRRLDQLVILPGVGAAVAKLNAARFACAIATNQEFVGHGYITRADHDAIMRAIVDACQSEGGRIAGVYACLHPKTVDCDDRKPKPGMLLQAAKELDLDLARSFMVGDQRKDMKAGRAAGARSVLVDHRLRTRMQGAHKFADHIARDLPDAVAWMIAASNAK